MKSQKRYQSHLLVAAASVTAGFSFLFGIAVYVAFFASYGNLAQAVSPQLKLMSANSTLLHTWYFVIYIVFGVALVAFQVGIKPYLYKGVVASIAMIFGYFWAALTIVTGMLANVSTHVILELMGEQRDVAISLWYTMQLLIDSIGGGNELVGSIWLVGLGLSLRSIHAIDRWLKAVALVFGAVGLLTAIPMLTELGGIFGFGCMAWFLVMGRYQFELYQKEK